MSHSTAQPKKMAAAPSKRSFDLRQLLLEGRAFIALIAIVVAFSFLSPHYATTSNFLIMASHVAIYGILAIGMLMVILTAASISRSARCSASPAASPAS